MIVPDVNLLIFAHDSSSPNHAAARSWWEDALSGTEPIGIPWVVLLAFVRLTTHPTINSNPMTVRQSRDAAELWLAQPQVRLLNTGVTTFPQFFDHLEKVGTGGNLSTDALIAALAAEHGGVVYTTDTDFARFENIVSRNPISR